MKLFCSCGLRRLPWVIVACRIIWHTPELIIGAPIANRV
jgi:hypothetical protein